MNRIILIILITLSSIIAQNVRVINDTNLTSNYTEQFYFPQFSPDNNFLLFTKANYKGLYKFNLSNSTLEVLTDDFGSGFDPIITADNKSIIYRSDEFINNLKYSSIVIQNLATGESKTLVENSRNVASVLTDNNNGMFFNINGENSIRSLVNNEIVKSSNKGAVFTYVKNDQLILNRDGLETNISPFGAGAYVWASLSPDKNKIVFTFGAKGSFICDLQGKVITDLGYANYPQWSPDGNWILAMQDYDDGYVFTKSEIYLISSDGQKKIKLTNTEDQIEMYGRWSYDGKKIVYHTDDGNIHLLTLEFE